MEQCTRCNGHITKDQKVCECGAATANMTFQERAAWEVSQWRAYQERAQSA
jgi:hypothetical protein